MKTYILVISYLICSTCILSQNQAYNYIKTRTITDETDPNKYLDVIQYYDGLGRPIQTVQSGVTYTHNSLVTLQEYDIHGRAYTTWLPAIITGKYDNFTNTTSLKSSTIASNLNDPDPYSKTIYEASSLDRILEQYEPGANWYNSNSSNKINHSTNEVIGNRSCICFKVNGNGLNTSLIQSRAYDGRELYVTETINEIGNSFYEFRNKQNQVILIRQMNNNEPHDTYYVYDDFGNLAYVIPPMLVDKIIKENKSTTDNSLEIKQYAYLYKYDERNRCIRKRLPGCEWIYYVYDKADRLIFTQDAEQRKQGEWIYSIPDVLGRIVETGICRNTNVSNAYYKDKIVTGTYTGGKSYSFSNFNPVDNKCLTINYYDNYDFLTSLKKEIVDILRYEERQGYGKQYNPNSYSANGLLTGTYVNTINSSWEELFDEYSALYYDDNNRLIQSKRTRMYELGFDKEYIAYNFQGQPLKKLHEHSIAGLNQTNELYSYEYDHAGRLIETKHKLNNGNDISIANNIYDEFGRVTSTGINGQRILETKYTYDIRSRATEILNGIYEEYLRYDNIGNVTFIYDIGYSRTNTREWNISIEYDELSRMTKYIDIHSANSLGIPTALFQYDKHGNIKSARRMSGIANRHNDLDNLTITHSGNQMQYVVDSSIESDRYYSYDFRDITGAGTSASYKYDLNGSIIEDPYKGTRINNNYLHLPEKITVNNPLTSGNIEYMYLATGEKLGSISSISLRRSLNPSEIAGGVLATESTDRSEATFYCGNIIYKITDEIIHLDKILIDNGYIKDGNYYFYIRDHLGNNRVTTTSSGRVKAKDDYFPYGMPVRKTDWEENLQTYKFGNKEFEILMRLNLYDFHARLYDPVLARFTSIDPHAEKYYSTSPYVYCNNNPVNMIDPDGRDAIFIAFPDYKISTPVGRLSNLGHAGVLLIDNKTGLTKYYEYGRYDKEGKGEVRTKTISNVKIGDDGKPTAESLGKVLGEISEKAGQGGKIEGAYVESDKFTEMNDYAKTKMAENNDSDRKSYSLTGNNCGTFAVDVIKQDSDAKKKAPNIVDPRPNSIVKEYQEKFTPITYNPEKEKKK